MLDAQGVGPVVPEHAARGPLVLALSDLRAAWPRGLATRMRMYREHHGRKPDDASTLRSWLEVRPSPSDWILMTHRLGVAGRRLGLAVATAAVRRELARVDADSRSVQAVNAVEAVLDAYRRGAPDDEIALLREITAHVARPIARDTAAYAAAAAAAKAATANDEAAAAHAAARIAVEASRVAARVAGLEAVAPIGPFLADVADVAYDAERAKQRQDFLAELDRIEGGSL